MTDHALLQINRNNDSPVAFAPRTLDDVQLEIALREHGHRVTRPRRVVWEVLSTTEGHLSAHEVTERVHALDPGINPSSIYRTLALFSEIDLARESRLGDAATWEQAHPDAVIHLLCSQCGAVQHHHATSIDDLPTEIAHHAGFRPDGIDVRVTGLCRTCAAPVSTS
jgi:Fur family ferric uptake transcriptional regulator